MIVITGSAGFIGSCLVGKLNEEGVENILLVDDFSVPAKTLNWKHKQFLAALPRMGAFETGLAGLASEISFVIHLGARTDTAETDTGIFETLNTGYSQSVWNFCTAHSIPLIYASSAATYGAGENGYSDDHALVNQLRPLNPYGQSKQDFDCWVLAQAATPPFWAGLKFFNVYGPNEYHKKRMASVVFHAFHQVQSTGMLRLFRSHKPGVADGMQMRDFIYVKEVVKVILWMMEHELPSGLYNVGSGKSNAFIDLGSAVFNALGKTPDIEFIDIPEDIRETYQYFTEADMQKLIKAGYPYTMATLTEGINDYITHYLDKQAYL